MVNARCQDEINPCPILWSPPKDPVIFMHLFNYLGEWNYSSRNLGPVCTHVLVGRCPLPCRWTRRGHGPFGIGMFTVCLANSEKIPGKNQESEGKLLLLQKEFKFNLWYLCLSSNLKHTGRKRHQRRTKPNSKTRGAVLNVPFLWLLAHVGDSLLAYPSLLDFQQRKRTGSPDCFPSKHNQRIFKNNPNSEELPAFG